MVDSIKPKWIIEHVFDDDCRNLVNSLNDQGIDYKIVSNPLYEGEWRLYDDDDCVITYGSIQFNGMIERKAKWIPGSIHTPENYFCSTYYPHFKHTLLNDDYFMLPFADLPNKIDLMFDTFGQEDTIFIRPDSGNKTFTGQMVHKERFARDYDILSIYQPKPNSICVVSSPKNVTNEWRFFVVGDEIVCGSQYKKGRHTVPVQSWSCTSEGDIDNNDWWALRYAKFVITEEVSWRPDKVWCLDICQTKPRGEFYVLEIGSFNAAGLYESDTTELVKAVNKIAVEEWKEYHELEPTV